MSGTLGLVYRITFFVLLMVFSFGFQYIFPMEARFKLKPLALIRNAYLFSIISAPYTLLSFIVPAAALYLTFFMNPMGFHMAVFFWAVCGFALVSYLNSFIFLKAFRKLGVRLGVEDICSEERPEGALFTDESHRRDELMSPAESCSMPDWNSRKM